FFSSRRRHTRCYRDWSSDVCSSDLLGLYALQRRGLLEPRGLTPSPPPAGPFLMWKTVRGRNLIDRLARPKRFWRIFGDVAILLVALTMVGTTVLLAWEATLVQSAAIRGN